MFTRLIFYSPVNAACAQRPHRECCDACPSVGTSHSLGSQPKTAQGRTSLVQLFRLAQTIEQPSLPTMDYIYPINLVGHNEWLDSGYEPKLAQGDVVTRDGEFLGMWRVVGYDHVDEYSSGRIEFILDGENTVKFAEDFAGHCQTKPACGGQSGSVPSEHDQT